LRSVSRSDFRYEATTASRLQSACEFAIHPIRMHDIQPSEPCLAPTIQVQPGRPRKKRMRKKARDNRGKRILHCSICHSAAHRRTQCDGTGPTSGTDREDEAEAAEQGTSSGEAEEEEQVIAAEAAAENDGDWRTARRLARQAIQISNTQASQEVEEDQDQDQELAYL